MELVDRCFGAEWLATQLLGQEAHAVQAHCLDAGIGLGDSASDDGILAHRAPPATRRLRYLFDLYDLADQPYHL